MHDEIEFMPLAPAPAAGGDGADLRRLHDVPVELAVEIGRTRMTIGQTLELRPGSVVSLNRLAGEPVDLLINGKPIARGEVVVIDEEFGLRVTDVVAGGRHLQDEAAQPRAVVVEKRRGAHGAGDEDGAVRQRPLRRDEVAADQAVKEPVGEIVEIV